MHHHVQLSNHLQKPSKVLACIQMAGLKINAAKSFFAKPELEYLGFWETRHGIQPLKTKIKAILDIALPVNQKQLCRFLGMINYYQDMWL